MHTSRANPISKCGITLTLTFMRDELQHCFSCTSKCQPRLGVPASGADSQHEQAIFGRRHQIDIYIGTWFCEDTVRTREKCQFTNWYIVQLIQFFSEVKLANGLRL